MYLNKNDGANTRICTKKIFSPSLGFRCKQRHLQGEPSVTPFMFSHDTSSFSICIKVKHRKYLSLTKKNIWTYFQVSKTKQEDFLERRNIKGWLALVNVRQCWTCLSCISRRWTSRGTIIDSGLTCWQRKKQF